MRGYGQAFTHPIIARVGSRVINKISRKPIFGGFPISVLTKFISDKRKLEDWLAKALKYRLYHFFKVTNTPTCRLVGVQEVLAREEKSDRQIGSKKSDCTIHFEITHCGLNLFAQTQESFS